jgi:hypothetical protein
VRGDAEAEAVDDRGARASLPLVERQQRLSQCQRGAAGRLRSCGNRAVFANDYGRRLSLEERLGATVRG